MKLDIVLSPVDSIAFTREYECSCGRNVSYLRSVVDSHVGSSHSVDPVRTLVGGRRISSSLDRGLEVLGFLSLWSVLVTVTRGFVLSNGPDAIFDDLHSTTHASLDPVRLVFVDWPICPNHGRGRGAETYGLTTRFDLCLFRKGDMGLCLGTKISLKREVRGDAPFFPTWFSY